MEFSSWISESTILSAADGRIHPVDVLKALLEMIERYEHIDPDGYPARQRRFIQDVDPGESLYFQIYFPILDSNLTSYSESNSNKVFLNTEEWQNIDIYLSDPKTLREGNLRLKPLNTLGFVSISGLKLVNAATGRECWSFENKSAAFVVAKDAIILPAGQRLEIMVTGDDPELLLPTLPDLPDCPMSLSAWIKVSRSQRDFHRYWKDLNSENERLHKNEQTFEEMKKILRNQEETLYKAHNDLREKQESLANLKEQLMLNNREFAGLKAETDRLDQQIQDKDRRLQEARENLGRQKNLTREYFNALAGAEKRQLRLEWKVDGLSKANTHLQARIKNLREAKDRLKLKVRSLSQERAQLQGWMKDLYRQYVSLLNSRRWRIGNALVTYAGFAFGRPGRAQGMDRMGVVFTRFQRSLQLKDAAALSDQAENDGSRTIRRMERLQKDFQLVIGSRSWRLGNRLVHLVSNLFLQTGKPASVTRMKEIFRDFQGWKCDVNPTSLTGQDMKQLARWMALLQKDFNALFASRRWWLGRAFSAPARVFRRRSGPGVVERVKAVFEEYHG
jgi:hypothetical protein